MLNKLNIINESDPKENIDNIDKKKTDVLKIINDLESQLVSSLVERNALEEKLNDVREALRAKDIEVNNCKKEISYISHELIITKKNIKNFEMQLTKKMEEKENTKSDFKVIDIIQADDLFLRAAKSLGRITALYKKYSNFDVYQENSELVLDNNEPETSKEDSQLNIKSSNSHCHDSRTDIQNIVDDENHKSLEMAFENGNERSEKPLEIACEKDSVKTKEPLEMACENDNEKAEDHYRHGVLHNKREEYDKAIECFKMAVSLQPEQERFYKSL